ERLAGPPRLVTWTKCKGTGLEAKTLYLIWLNVSDSRRRGYARGGRGMRERLMAACRPGGTVLSVLVCESLECFLIDREIFALSNGDDFDQDLLVDDPVHDTDRFLRCVEFVIAGEIAERKGSRVIV
ncbi:MAG: hypothetical protein WAU44_17935, partial [Nitrospira sp.]